MGALKKRIESQGPDFYAPAKRRLSEFYIDWLDHGLLRRVWTNEMEFAPGAWRSNHPSERRLRGLSGRGIHTVLSLRGATLTPYTVRDKLLCDALGLSHINLPMTSREAPQRQAVLDLIGLFREIPHPFLMHCKSGADRTSLASAIYKMVIEGTSLREAKAMMSMRFIHFRWTKTGILDAFLEAYAPFENKIDFETWVREHYDPSTLKR